MSLSRIAIIGANGQIGRALTAKLGSRAIPLTRGEVDLADMEESMVTLEAIAPDAVINAAAYTQVDKAEEEPELASVINGTAPGELAKWCAGKGIAFVHYSTDYVFDGAGEKPWREGDTVHPLNVYGKSKRDGEEAVMAAGGDFLIFRTSWVYDAYGKNFFNTMLRLGAEREQLRVVNDQHGAPCYAPHLAAATISCLEKAAGMQSFPCGIYHLANAGETSWHGFAEAIFAAARKAGIELKVKAIEPISSNEYPTPAKRPLNSRLNVSKLHTVFGERLPNWEAGLAEAIKEKCHAGN